MIVVKGDSRGFLPRATVGNRAASTLILPA